MFQILKRIFSLNLEESGTNNVVNNRDFPKCSFKILGNNNRIIISPEARMTGRICVYGNDNIIQVGEGSFLRGCIEIGRPNSSFSDNAQGCNLKIGKNVYASENTFFILADDETKVSIGDASIFARGSRILASDMHSVVDEEGNLLNKASYVRVGCHVWFCIDSKILKNSVVNDNCIVGAGSVVTHDFWEPNTLIAGNPAKVVRRNINWDKLSPNMYERQKD